MNQTVETEIAFFTSLERELIGRGMEPVRATAWARAQIDRARQRRHKGRAFSLLALCGGEAAETITRLDAAGLEPRAWF